MKELEGFFYVSVHETKEDDIDYDKSTMVKVKVVSSGIDVDKDGVLSFLVNVKPCEKLPMWFDDLKWDEWNEEYICWFHNLSLEYLHRRKSTLHNV